MGLRDDIQGLWRQGGMLYRLILVNTGVFLLLRLVDLIFFLFGSDGPDLVGLLMSTSSPAGLLRTPWTVVTYMFTHWGLWHLFFNMLILFYIGRIFEDLLGGKRLLGNYLLGGFAGLALYFLGYNLLPAFERYAQASTILGASAAVMGVFIGIATYRPDLEIRLLILGTIKLKWLALIYVFIDLVSIREGGNSGGHLAHLGGAIYGYLAARQLMKGRDPSLRLVQALEAIGRAFTPRKGPRMKVAKKPVRNVMDRDAGFNAAKRDKQARVDAILDKIGRSGYDSLTKEEKDFLFKASQ
ncbi:MAG: rhomboid family intramembrane serine protease [Flavobacteriales bacterium]|nr:rhomboid family intramembrane serine protease [Flavobacteriales bacterium]